MRDPIRVDDMVREFERLRAQRDDKPVGLAAWAAFIALAERPAEAGAAAAGLSEDLLMFDVAAYEGEQPNIRLARIVGLEDADGDYVGSRTLECVLLYDAPQAAPEVRSGCIKAWLYPDLGRADLATFVEQATATTAFRLLVERREPTEISALIT